MAQRWRAAREVSSHPARLLDPGGTHAHASSNCARGATAAAGPLAASAPRSTRGVRLATVPSRVVVRPEIDDAVA
jgi:hypothetical protein